jgi:hypothetical protein
VCREQRAARNKFARDSLLEGNGFEPSVPHKKQPFLASPVRSRNSPSATKIGSIVPGTDGSNPSPSRGESTANLAVAVGRSATPLKAPDSRIHFLPVTRCFSRVGFHASAMKVSLPNGVSVAPISLMPRLC